MLAQEGGGKNDRSDCTGILDDLADDFVQLGWIPFDLAVLELPYESLFALDVMLPQLFD